MASSTEIQLPHRDELVLKLVALSARIDSIARYLQAYQTRQFQHPDGRTDDLGAVVLSPEAAGLLSYTAADCATPVSVEIGFGMGFSAAVILGTRANRAERFEHLIFDPLGLGKGRGDVVEAYLQSEFGENYRRVRKRSEVGLAQLIEERGRGIVGLCYIDGGHRFENVMTDFVLADLPCCEGGHIIFDDALFPAIETVINYIISNRPDYAVAHRVVPNTTLVKKIGPDQRGWSAFTPFKVPDRHDWTPDPLPRQA